MIDADIRQLDLFIDGQFSPARRKQYFESVNPSDGRMIAKVADANIDDMEAAIAAARRAFDNGIWPTLSVAERGIYLKKIAKLIRQHAKELAMLESTDTGKTIKQCTLIDVPTCADTFEYFGGISSDYEIVDNKVDAPVKSQTQREPMGVIAAIIPWNYPLIMAAWKIAPALVTGNTIVLKPSPLASVSVLRLAEIFKEAGMPEGVINIVTTSSNDVAAALVKHQNIDMISFSGGTETGKTIMRLAAEQTKKITLELGGKSPNIIFSDCDKSAAIGGSLSAIFMNQGQMCTAGSRLLVEESVYDDVINRLIDKARKLKIGNAADYQTEFGPVISRHHRDQLIRSVQQAVDQGAQLACGGKIPENVPENGAYIEPTILTGITPEMKIAREEVFGPVLAVMKFASEEEAVAMANDTRYGLACSIWTKDLKKAERVSQKMKCGTVWINTYGGFYNEASFGGYKQSGFGRELGREGLLEFTQSKHVCVDQTPGGMPLVASWF